MTIADHLEDVQLVSIAETARALSVSEQTIRRLVQDGTLHAVRVRGQVRLDAREVRQLAGAGGE